MVLPAQPGHKQPPEHQRLMPRPEVLALRIREITKSKAKISCRKCKESWAIYLWFSLNPYSPRLINHPLTVLISRSSVALLPLLTLKATVLLFWDTQSVYFQFCPSCLSVPLQSICYFWNIHLSLPVSISCSSIASPGLGIRGSKGERKKDT